MEQIGIRPNREIIFNGRFGRLHVVVTTVQKQYHLELYNDVVDYTGRCSFSLTCDLRKMRLLFHPFRQTFHIFALQFWVFGVDGFDVGQI
jgi:hypothetical protein